MKKCIVFLLILSFFTPNISCFSLVDMVIKNFKSGSAYPSADVFMKVLNACTEKFKQEVEQVPYAKKLIVPAGSKIGFMGDIHGSFESECNNLGQMIQLGFLNDELKVIDPRFKMIFLGDYVDRGLKGVEVLYTLAILKLQNWESVVLLRGNHEIDYNNFKYGLLEEIRKKYYPKEKDLNSVWDSPVFNSVSEFFKWLPIVLFLGSGNKMSWIQCCHGGFEPAISDKFIKNFLMCEATILDLKECFKIYNIDLYRCGFLWNDFYDNDDLDKVTIPNYTRENSGYLINHLALRAFCEEYGIKAIFRGHQHSSFGLKIGGCEPFSMKCHWTNFENGRLLNEAEKNKDGFLIYNIIFPVFTFSTASQANVAMEYDCFGILTTADDYKNWKLKPYEFVFSGESNILKYLVEFSQKKTNKKKSACCKLISKCIQKCSCCSKNKKC